MSILCIYKFYGLLYFFDLYLHFFIRRYSSKLMTFTYNKNLKKAM